MMSTKEKRIKAPPRLPKLHYRLYRLRGDQGHSAYQLEIRFGKERFCARLATTDERLAKEIYARMLAGRVTPCTACDVLQDLQS
jgi:hypothetical protein